MNHNVCYIDNVLGVILIIMNTSYHALLFLYTDKENPVPVNCPKHDILITGKGDNTHKELVKLPNIQFTDNVDVKSIVYSHPNPVEIKTGSQETITVVARDSAGNMEYCTFKVHVDGKSIWLICCALSVSYY